MPDFYTRDWESEKVETRSTWRLWWAAPALWTTQVLGALDRLAWYGNTSSVEVQEFQFAVAVLEPWTT